MSDHSKREYSFRQLLEDNLIVSNLLRKVAGPISDPSLENYFLSLANKRSQFAVEISEEIAFYGGKKPFIPPHVYDRRWTKLASADSLKIIKNFYKLHKQSFEKYKDACRRSMMATVAKSLLGIKPTWKIPCLNSKL